MSIAYGIKPRTIRIGEQVAKGYVKEDLVDPFRRYIPKSEVEAFKANLAERRVPQTGTGSDAARGTDGSGSSGKNVI